METAPQPFGFDEARRVKAVGEEEGRIIEAERRRLGLDV